MYVLEVIPLTNLPPQVPPILSYFYHEAVPKGALVEATLGKRAVPAIVIHASNLETEKLSLKKSFYQLKKLQKVLNPLPQVSDHQLKLASWISKYYFASLGVCLKTILPPFFGKKTYPITPREPKIAHRTQKFTFIPTPAKGSVEKIKALIKDSGEHQVFLLVPDIALGQYYHQTLAHPLSVLIHSGLSNKELHEAWQKIQSGEIEVVIGSRAALFLPFHNLKTIIVDDPSHELYKSDMMPRYHAVDVAQQLAELTGANIVHIGSLPTLEAYHLNKQGAGNILSPPKTNTPRFKIISLVDELKTGNFLLFGRQAQSLLLDAITQQKKVLIFSARRAYAGMLVCSNCGITLRCHNCSLPMRVHKSSEELLICYHCTAYQATPKQCPNCHSAKLTTAGAPGSQKIQEHLSVLLKNKSLDTKSFILDSDLITDSEEETRLLQEWQDTPGSILIATQMIFSYRHSMRFDTIIIPHADALVSALDFRTEERLFQNMATLLDFEPSKVILQTFREDPKLFQDTITKNYKEFYDTELASREVLKYPPFVRIAKLSFRHRDKARAFREARMISERLRMAAVQLGYTDKVQISEAAPAYIEREKNIYTFHIIVKLSPTLERPESILKFVPSTWLIDLDPRST